MATTSPDNIYSPDAGQQYALTQDLLAMADSVQAAFTGVRDRTLGSSGPAGGRASVTPKVGARYTTTDTTPQQTWLGTGTSWVLDSIPRTAFAPSFSNLIVGTGAVTLGDYLVTGGLLHGQLTVKLGSSPALNASTAALAPPVTPSTIRSGLPLGLFTLVDSGVGWKSGLTRQAGDGKIELWFNYGDYSSAMNANNNAGFGVDDTLLITFQYPV